MIFAAMPRSARLALVRLQKGHVLFEYTVTSFEPTVALMSSARLMRRAAGARAPARGAAPMKASELATSRLAATSESLAIVVDV